MAVVPVVRYMILCEDWEVDALNPRKVDILGLLNNVDSLDEPKYPLLIPEICVFLFLTETRGVGTVEIVCTYEETSQIVFRTPKRTVAFQNNPLEVVAVSFRIKDCRFPQEGIYSFQFCYNGEVVEQRPLRMR